MTTLIKSKILKALKVHSYEVETDMNYDDRSEFKIDPGSVLQLIGLYTMLPLYSLTHNSWDALFDHLIISGLSLILIDRVNIMFINSQNDRYIFLKRNGLNWNILYPSGKPPRSISNYGLDIEFITLSRVNNISKSYISREYLEDSSDLIDPIFEPISFPWTFKSGVIEIDSEYTEMVQNLSPTIKYKLCSHSRSVLCYPVLIEEQERAYEYEPPISSAVCPDISVMDQLMGDSELSLTNFIEFQDINPVDEFYPGFAFEEKEGDYKEVSTEKEEINTETEIDQIDYAGTEEINTETERDQIDSAGTEEIFSDKESESDLSSGEIATFDYTATTEESDIPILPPLVLDSKMFYHYLLDTYNFVFNSMSDTITVFEHIQCGYLNLISHLELKGKMPNKYLVRLFAKVRHNFYSSLCTQMMGITRKLETDADLKQYGINMTPDLYIESSDICYLIEFTVGNNLERSVFLKSGGELDSNKYTNIARDLESLRGIRHESQICYFVLNDFEQCTQEIAGVKLDMKILKEFFDICQLGKQTVNSMMVESYSTVCELNTSDRERAMDILDYLKSEGRHNPFTLKFDSLDPDLISALDKFKIRDVKKLKSHPEDLFELIYNTGTKKITVEIGQGFKGKYIYENLNSINILTKIKKVDSKGKPINTPGIINLSTVDDTNIPKSEYQPNRMCLSFECYNKPAPTCHDVHFVEPYPGDEDLISDCKLMIDGVYETDVINSLDHEKLIDRDVKKKMLVNAEMSGESISKAKESLLFALNEENSGLVEYSKPSFIYPLATGNLRYGRLYEWEAGFLDTAIANSNKYTREALTKMRDGNFIKRVKSSDFFDEWRSRMKENESKINRKLRDTFGVIKKRKEVTNPDAELESLYSARDKLNSELKSIYSRASSGAMQGTVKVQISGKNSMRGYAEDEMKHFGKKSGHKSGFTRHDKFSTLDDEFRFLCDILTSKAEEVCRTDLVTPVSEIGSDFLVKERLTSMSLYQNSMDNYKKTILGKACEYIESFCYTLMRFSTNSLNHNYIQCSNMGYKNSFIICRGGPKIFKSGRSRLFRYCIPISCEIENIFGGASSGTFFYHESQRYYLSGWTQMHEEVIKHGLTMYRRVFLNLAVNLQRTSRDFSDIPCSILFNIILAFHNKRRTEGALHNMRYMIVNPLGEYAELSGIIKSFAYPDYTSFDFWVKRSILNNFEEFASKIKQMKDSKSKLTETLSRIKLSHLVTKDAVETEQDLVNMIYCTYLMTKAPISKANEQATNLLSILEDVSEFKEKHGFDTDISTKSMQFDLRSCDPSVYDDDFKYDPRFCQYLGVYMGSYLKSKIGVHKINEMWMKSLQKPITELANSRGLRGTNKNDFFNKKGHEIVYQAIQEAFGECKALADTINDAINKYERNVASDQIDEKDMCLSEYICKTIPLEFDAMIFHVVEKVQRALGREVFVMNLYTKATQNPIESFVGDLCRYVENEMISVESSKRPSVIHHDYYEAAHKRDWVKSILLYTLDCRRWGPHAVFQKYIHFIYAMSPVLPKSFIMHFMSMSSKMFKKKFVTRQYVINVLKNNQNYKPHQEFVKESLLADDALEIAVEFSFVMGIFNYLSSIMHAANQMVAAEMILKYHLQRGEGLVLMSMKAHSDDSCGESAHEFEYTTRSTVALYDWLLKASNHMLSIKKTVVTRGVYMEFLSILYLMGQNLPVISKFIGDLPFTPSDKGYGADIKTAISRSTEICTNGGTFSEGYLTLKLMAKHIQRLYNIDEPSKKIPSDYMGDLDMHPLEFLLSSDDPEILQHLYYNRANLNRVLSVVKTFFPDLRGYVPKLEWDMGSRMNKKLLDKFNAGSNEVMDSWTIQQGGFRNCAVSLLWFCNKLKERTFYSSLINEPSTRRLARLYGVQNRLVGSKEAKLTASDLRVALEVAIESEIVVADNLESNFKFYCNVNFEQYHFYTATDTLSNCEIKSINTDVTAKPITISISSPTIQNIKSRPALFVTQLKEPKMLPLYGKRMLHPSEVQSLSSYLIGMGLDLEQTDNDDLLRVCEKVVGVRKETKRLLSYVESGDRFYDTMEKIFLLLSTNSIYKVKRVIPTSSIRIIDTNMRISQSRTPRPFNRLCKRTMGSECLRRMRFE